MYHLQKYKERYELLNYLYDVKFSRGGKSWEIFNDMEAHALKLAKYMDILHE